jgi:addiction module RelE/StbE family toxin
MKCKLHYSREALNDLDEIWEYIQTELCNPGAAEKAVHQILDKAEQLVDFPRKGALLSSIANMVDDYRYLISGNYLLFYRVEGNDVYIDRVLYARRDYMHILFGSEKS